MSEQRPKWEPPYDGWTPDDAGPRDPLPADFAMDEGTFTFSGYIDPAELEAWYREAVRGWRERN